MGRIQLVKSVVTSMLLHSFHIYLWPISLLKFLERCIKNFIWSGDVYARKLVTVPWSKVCSASVSGGLNIRSLRTLNEAATF